MQIKINKNIKFFRRYWFKVTPQILRTEKFNENKYNTKSQKTTSKNQPMNPIKSLLLFSLKLVIFLALTNIVLIKPLSNSISKGLENFDNNPLFKIISLDFISNPLTFIRMSEYYLEKNAIKKAELYLEYAEVIKARYPYPVEVNDQLLELRVKIKSNLK